MRNIKDLTKDIVRIGGRSEEGLEEFNIRDQLKKHGITHKGFYSIKTELDATRKLFAVSKKYLEKYQLGMLSSFISRVENTDCFEIVQALREQFYR